MGNQDSKIIKNYCLVNNGGVFDVKYLSDSVFKEIAYDNVRQIVRRLTRAEILIPYDRGIYLIGKSDKSNDERITEHYLYNYGELRRGMLTGASLFYELGLIDKKPEFITIRTNKATRREKVVNLMVEPTKTVYSSGGLFPSYEISIALELISHRELVNDSNLSKYMELRHKYASMYTDAGMKFIANDFSGNDVVRLATLLEDMNISNRAIEINVETSHLQNL